MACEVPDCIELFDTFGVDALGVIFFPLLKFGEAALFAVGGVGLIPPFACEILNRLNHSTFAATLVHANAVSSFFNSAAAAACCSSARTRSSFIHAR